VSNKIDPVSDIEVINLELVLADTETVTNRLGNLGKDVKKGDKIAIFENEVLQKVAKHLELGKMVNTLALDEKETPVVKQLNLLSAKPILYCLNKKAGGKNLDELADERWTKLLQFLEENNFKHVVVDAKIEDELKDLVGEEKEMFRKGLTGLGTGMHDSAESDDGIDRLIKSGYELLNLITYFTTGEDESRAWTIVRDSTAPVAGMAIHTDFRDKFIRAEVVFWSDLLSAGSYSHAREKGLVRTEGKEYVVKDGDTIEFKI
jgi:GTP-binding protein YchF